MARHKLMWLRNIKNEAGYRPSRYPNRSIWIEDRHYYKAHVNKRPSNVASDPQVCCYWVGSTSWEEDMWFPNAPPKGVMILLKIKREL